jgi:type IV secretion system protein TrbL
MPVFARGVLKKALEWSGNNMKKFFAPSVFIFFLTLMVHSAHAGALGINNADLLDSILVRFANTASGWGARLVDLGTWL